jgi:hypothetical protein
MMRTASPGPTAISPESPGKISPISLRDTGSVGLAPNVSAARTAYPSMALLSNAGTSTVATTSWANVRSRA